MKTAINRLVKLNWQATIVTSTHHLFYKKGWRCTVSKVDGTMTFSKKVKRPISIMRGEIEKGID